MNTRKNEILNIFNYLGAGMKEAENKELRIETEIGVTAVRAFAEKLRERCELAKGTLPKDIHRGAIIEAIDSVLICAKSLLPESEETDK